MVGFLRGILLDREGTKAIIDINGVGYSVCSTPDYLSRIKIGETASFWVTTIVREQEISLYGFETKDESRIFELLLTVSGVGPKSSLAILSVAGLKTIEDAIDRGESAPLTKIVGVGKKTAEKIIFELSGKLPKKKDSVSDKEDRDIFDALKSLGYRDMDIKATMDEMPKDLQNTNAKIMWALKAMGK